MSNPQRYYEVTGTGPFGWKVYHYDETGNNEVIVVKSTTTHDSQEKALDACCEWMEDNNIQDAELS